MNSLQDYISLKEHNGPLKSSNKSEVKSAPFIEIIGPPGSGKTTIYELLCTARRASSGWTCVDALVNPKPPLTDVKNRITYQMRKWMNRKASKTLPVDYGLKFISNHQGLADFCWNLLSERHTGNDNTGDRRFRSAYFLFLDFCRYQAILNNEHRKPCIVNEGLLQKSFLVGNKKGTIEEFLSAYLDLIPLPQAVININVTNTDLILDRLHKRKKVIASHNGMDDTALLQDLCKWKELFFVMVSLLKEKNIMIIDIESEAPGHINVQVIERFLRKQQ